MIVALRDADNIVHLSEDGERTLCGIPVSDVVKGAWPRRLKPDESKQICPKCGQALALDKPTAPTEGQK